MSHLIGRTHIEEQMLDAGEIVNYEAPVTSLVSS